MELKNIRRGSDAGMVITLFNDGVQMDFSTMSEILVAMYSDTQRAFAGRCEIIDASGTAMKVLSPAANQRYTGPFRMVLTCTFEGRTATYDALAYNVVATSAEVDAQGMTAEQETADIGIDLTVSDVTSSLVLEVLAAAVKATDEAHYAALLATEKATLADASAVSANEAAQNATEKATLANEAAQRAEEAVGSIEGKFEEQAALIEQKLSEQDATIEAKYGELSADVESRFSEQEEALDSKFTEQIASFNATVVDAIERQDTLIEETFAEQDETITQRFAEQDEQIAKKASYDGKYPDLTSGFASQLVGRGESVEAEIGGIRASGGKSILDGSARIKELRGNAVVWNQWIRNGNFASTEGWTAMYGTLTASNNVGIFTLNESHQAARIQQEVPMIKGHWYYLTTTFKASSTTRIGMQNNGGFIFISGQDVSAGETFVFTKFVQVTADASIMYFYCNQNNPMSIGDTFEFSKIKFVDLTQMFGSGNEPTTIEEFYSRCPLGVDMNAYNEGEMIADNSTAIKSVGDNAWDEEWRNGIYNSASGVYSTNSTNICNTNPIKVLPNESYICNTSIESYAFFYDSNMNYIGNRGIYGGAFTTPSNAMYMNFYFGSAYGAIYNNDITISLYHSGWKAEVDNVYKPYVEFTREIDQRILDAFPNGRKPWDKVYNKNGKGYIVKGTGEVDTGTLNWSYSPVTSAYPHGFFYTKLNTDLNDKKIGGEALTARYVNGGFSDDKSMSSNSANTMVYIRDSAYTDAATFKTAMSGVMLWYELAEPEIIEYDEPFNLDYEVWDFGTEQLITDSQSAPINADIIYQFNAVDMIREHESEITALQEQIAALQSAIASLTSEGE